LSSEIKMVYVPVRGKISTEVQRALDWPLLVTDLPIVLNPLNEDTWAEVAMMEDAIKTIFHLNEGLLSHEKGKTSYHEGKSVYQNLVDLFNELGRKGVHRSELILPQGIQFNSVFLEKSKIKKDTFELPEDPAFRLDSKPLYVQNLLKATYRRNVVSELDPTVNEKVSATSVGHLISRLVQDNKNVFLPQYVRLGHGFNTQKCTVVRFYESNLSPELGRIGLPSYKGSVQKVDFDDTSKVEELLKRQYVGELLRNMYKQNWLRAPSHARSDSPKELSIAQDMPDLLRKLERVFVPEGLSPDHLYLHQAGHPRSFLSYKTLPDRSSWAKKMADDLSFQTFLRIFYQRNIGRLVEAKVMAERPFISFVLTYDNFYGIIKTLNDNHMNVWVPDGLEVPSLDSYERSESGGRLLYTKSRRRRYAEPDDAFMTPRASALPSARVGTWSHSWQKDW
jgi:hypothetical protein